MYSTAIFTIVILPYILNVVICQKGYETEYPQYLYKPDNYESGIDCNRQVYSEYINRLRQFKQGWYNRQYTDYKIPTEYRDTWDTYGGSYSSYPYAINLFGLIFPRPKKCCYRFKSRYLGNRRRLTGIYAIKRIRKEYRQLTDSQRNAFHTAVKALKTSGEWDIFVSLHRQMVSPFAHNGASFLPWHREFLLRLENALISKGYTHGLPYFDSTPDQTLPNPADSIVWSDDYLGNANGLVVTGLAADWPSIPDCQSIGVNLTRSIINGPMGQCFLFSDFDVNYVYTKKCFRDITCNTDCKFEADHAGVHNFVGGHMGNPSCAPSDPFFFLHHAFVDCIWEEFRQNHQETPIHKEYPSQANLDDVGTPPGGFGTSNGFEWNFPMLPFPGLLNGHGISTFYSKYYTCSRRSGACKIDSNCSSSLMWCHNGRCKPKLKPGADCSAFSSFPSVCGGVCPGIPVGAPMCCVSGTCQCCFKG